MNEYVSSSLELHLYFARIMKEHALFLEAGFLMPSEAYRQKSEQLKQQFEALLEHVVRISDGVIPNTVLSSGEIVTDFTLEAEQKTKNLTDISINTGITVKEKNLRTKRKCDVSSLTEQQISSINQRAIRLLREIIAFKEKILGEVLKCRLFTGNYPLLIDHIIREARLYLSYVEELEERGCIRAETKRSVELFWNRIMMEHALFIRGLLDPTEAELIDTADGFADDYQRLLMQARDTHDMTIATADALETTIRYQSFKTTGAMGINDCKIKSLILPLLADHVLREANHYLRILKNE